MNNIKLTDDIIKKYQLSNTTYKYCLYDQEQINNAQTDDIFSGCINAIETIPFVVKNRILKYIENPTEKMWEDIHSICIAGATTLWSAWGEIDSNVENSKYPDEPWKSYPRSDVLIKAIRIATEKHHQRIFKDLEEHKEIVIRLENEYPELKNSKIAQKNYFKV